MAPRLVTTVFMFFSIYSFLFSSYHSGPCLMRSWIFYVTSHKLLFHAFSLVYFYQLAFVISFSLSHSDHIKRLPLYFCNLKVKVIVDTIWKSEDRFRYAFNRKSKRQLHTSIEMLQFVLSNLSTFFTNELSLKICPFPLKPTLSVTSKFQCIRKVHHS